MKDEELVIDVVFKALCCVVVGVMSYIFLKLLNFDGLSAMVISMAGSVALFFTLLPQ